MILGECADVMRRSAVKKEYLMALLAVMIWGTLSPAGKMLLNDMPEIELLFITSAIAAVFLGITTIVTGHANFVRNLKLKDYGILVILAVIGTFLYSMTYFYGISQLTAQEATIINYLWPMMTVLFSWPVLHERLSGRSVAALLISFAGIAIMVTRLDLSSFRNSSIAGILACLAAAVSYGSFSALNKRFQYDQYVALTIYYFVTAVLLGCILLIHPAAMPADPAQIIGLLWVGIAVDGIAYLLWCQALIQGKTASISNIAYLTPFLSILAAKLLLDEPVSIFSFIGLAFILAGIAIQFRAPVDKSPE